MKIKILTLFIFFAGLFMAGCGDSEVEITKGSGSLIHESKTYPLDFLTMVTYGSNDLQADGNGDRLYVHDAIISYTGDGNTVFSFSVRDNNPSNGMKAGTYAITPHGDFQAHFALGGDGDSLAGTMKVSCSGRKYTFRFEGVTVDENVPVKTVQFTYTGGVTSEKN